MNVVNIALIEDADVHDRFIKAVNNKGRKLSYNNKLSKRIN